MKTMITTKLAHDNPAFAKRYSVICVEGQDRCKLFEVKAIDRKDAKETAVDILEDDFIKPDENIKYILREN